MACILHWQLLYKRQDAPYDCKAHTHCRISALPGKKAYKHDLHDLQVKLVKLVKLQKHIIAHGDRIMGFCSSAEYEAFVGMASAFEQLLLRSCMRLIKYYLHNSKASQATHAGDSATTREHVYGQEHRQSDS